jgi:hypothetical protein
MIGTRIPKSAAVGLFVPILLLIIGTALLDSGIHLIRPIGALMLGAVIWPLFIFERLFPLPRDPSYPGCCQTLPLDACCDPTFHVPTVPAMVASVAVDFVVYAALTYFIIWAFQKWNPPSPQIIELK